MANNGELTAKQARFVQCLLVSRTVHDAARAAQVGTRTADRWMTEPRVRAALSEAQADALAAVTRQLVGEMSGALDTLRAIHGGDDNPASSRVSAARAILDAGLKYTEMVDLARRVEELERRLGNG